MSDPKRAIFIRNSQGHSHTSQKRADRFVRKGQARWLPDGTLQFIESDFGHISAGRCAAKSLIFTDGTGIATLGQIAGLPVLNPVKLITDTNSAITRQGRKQSARCGQARVIVHQAAA